MEQGNEVRNVRMTRRVALRALIAAASAGPFAACGSSAIGDAPRYPRQRQDVGLSPRGIIRTLLGDLDPAELSGPTLFHEHLSGTTEFSANIDLMVDEARAALGEGVACVVDAGHPDMGRSLAALRRIASESGLPIVASAGYYTERSYPPSIASGSAEEIANELVRDINEQGLGALGEIGQQGGVMTPSERKVFAAVAMAHQRTGVPIFTHNAYMGREAGAGSIPRDSALRQLDVLESEGAKPSSIAIGHLCCLDDPSAGVAKAIAKRGAFVGFDRATLETVFLPDAERIVMARALIEAGYADQVLVSSEFYAESSLKRNGGGGIAQAATVFGPKLIAAGVADDVVNKILVENPKRFLAFVPRD